MKIPSKSTLPIHLYLNVSKSVGNSVGCNGLHVLNHTLSVKLSALVKYHNDTYAHLYYPVASK